MFVLISLFLVHSALVSWPSNGFLFLDMLCVLYVPIHQVHSNAIMGLPSRQPSPHFICMTAFHFLWFLLSFFVNVPLGLQEHDSVMIHAVMDTQQQKKSSGWYCGNIPWFTKRVGIERHTGGDLGSLGETSGGLKEEMVWCSIVDSFHIISFLFDLKQAVLKTRAAEIIGCIVDCSSSRCWWYFFPGPNTGVRCLHVVNQKTPRRHWKVLVVEIEMSSMLATEIRLESRIFGGVPPDTLSWG